MGENCTKVLFKDCTYNTLYKDITRNVSVSLKGLHSGFHDLRGVTIVLWCLSVNHSKYRFWLFIILTFQMSPMWLDIGNCLNLQMSICNFLIAGVNWIKHCLPRIIVYGFISPIYYLKCVSDSYFCYCLTLKILKLVN